MSNQLRSIERETKRNPELRKKALQVLEEMALVYRHPSIEKEK